jgi:hypothetical protein
VIPLQAGPDGHRILLVAAIAVLVVAAVTAFVVDQSPQRCAQTLACVTRLHGGRCLPGPCDIARHRAALRATEIMAVGVLLSGVLLLVRHRKVQAPTVRDR